MTKLHILPPHHATGPRLNRRPQFRALALATLALFTAQPHAAETTSRPNIIFILADDLGFGDLGCYGQRLIQTPHLDRMATQGMRFTQLYAGNTVCAPSRCTLLTGLHNGHAPVRGNKEVLPEGQSPMPADTFTLGKMLKHAGYQTALIGKWGLGHPGSASDPRKAGFDFFFGYNCQRQAHWTYPDYLWRNDQRVSLPGNQDGKRGQYAPDLLEAEALRYLAAHQDRPFFLYLALTSPHAELLVPEDSAAPYRGRWPETPFAMDGSGGDKHGFGAYRDSPTPRAAFAGMVSRMDRTVGRLLEQLQRLKLDDNTLVIFTSDNGPHKEGGADPDFFKSGGPLRGYKRDLTEGGIRVPFIARWPGRINPGTEAAQVGYFGDMMATFAELTGAPLPPTHDSISLLPTLTGRGIQKQHEYLYWEFYENGVSQAVLLNGRWKAIRRRQVTAPIQLYDLAADLGEQTDVAKQNPRLAARCAEIMRTAHVDNDDWRIPGLPAAPATSPAPTR
ncbi:MAG: arylsulfatase [Opitutaceae bacterium]|nr:arylsulfatase [Opitutaceae bacterium]